MTINRMKSGVAIAALMMLGIGGASSQTVDTTTFQVRATVVPVCTIQVNNVDFGTYNAAVAAPTDATSTITVRCTLSTPFRVLLNGGSATGGTIMSRWMSNGTNQVGYQLFVDNAPTSVWWDGAQGVSHSGAGSGVATALTVFARMSPSQFVQAGVYVLPRSRASFAVDLSTALRVGDGLVLEAATWSSPRLTIDDVRITA